LGGGWWVRGVQPKNWACLSKTIFNRLLPPCYKKLKQDNKDKTKNNSITTTVIIKDLMGELLIERLASGWLGAGQIASLTTRRILISLY